MRKTLAAIAKSLPRVDHQNQFEYVNIGGTVREQRRAVNHKKNIESAYVKGGKVAVLLYTEQMRDLANPNHRNVGNYEAKVKEVA